jgi:hypothetical protein
MTEPTPILVVFGIDGEGKLRASRFVEKDAELATKAAALLGFRTAWITDEAGCAITQALPDGNVVNQRGSTTRDQRPMTTHNNG